MNDYTVYTKKVVYTSYWVSADSEEHARDLVLQGKHSPSGCKPGIEGDPEESTEPEEILTVTQM